MSKEQYTNNLADESHTNASKDLSNSSIPARIGPYRSISAKRPRDPSHRKSVSFNDVPIVHEVPSHDIMRSSNCDPYRSWTYTDATTPTSVIPSLYSTQTISPLNSTNTTAQKLYASRLGSALYSTSSTLTTPNRMPDWTLRTKTPPKTASTTEETHTTHESTPSTSSPVIVVHTPDDKINKDTPVKSMTQSIYNSPYITYPYSIPTPASTSYSPMTSENGEDKRYSYRSPLIPETEHVRGLPFSTGSSTNSTPTYSSVFSSNYSTNEQLIMANTRAARARSAMTPATVTQPSMRMSDTISITPFRTATAAFSGNGSTASTRAILRPSTVAFQCTQPGTTTQTTTTNTINSSSPVPTTATTNNLNTANSLSTTTTKSFTVPPRFTPSATATSRFMLPPNRTFSSAALTSSAIRYAFAQPAMDSTLTNPTVSQATMPKPPPTAYPRSRSASVLNMRRGSASPVVMIDGQSHGGAGLSSTDPTANLYTTTKRSPNVRQTYGAYYMHRVLLPTTTN